MRHSLSQAKVEAIKKYNLDGGSGAICKRTCRAMRSQSFVNNVQLLQSRGNELANHIDGEEI